MAVEYLSPQRRADLNIFTTHERMQPTLPGVEEATVVTSQGVDVESDPPSHVERETVTASRGPASDAPLCMQCGTQMSRAGSCYACSSCGNTSGCS
jgi:ribonucleoside-diphosphate reductase alpha chain